MLGTIGETLPLGIGIAINPIAIVAGILILASANARTNSIAFTVSWLLGLTLLTFLALTVHQQVSARPDTPRHFVSLLKVGLGVVLIGGAARLIFFPGEPEGKMPKWMRFLDQIGTPRAAGLGLFLSTVSLKNIALVVGAASIIEQADLAVKGVLITLAVFLLLSTIGILIPLLVHLRGGERATAVLASWRQWLIAHVSIISAIVMVILGLLMISQGIVALV